MCTAKYLADAGHIPILLEARDVLGGKVHLKTLFCLRSEFLVTFFLVQLTSLEKMLLLNL